MNWQIILENLINWILPQGIKILLILIAGLVIVKIGRVVIKKIIRQLVEKTYKIKDIKIDKEQEKKEATLSRVFISFFKGLVWIIVILTILPEIGINIGPLLVGLGVAGLALGMGARNLIQDYLSGFFIIFEDQYRVGEEVEIAGTKGRVLDINLRRTLVQNKEKVVYYISNGQVKTVSNFSRK